MESTEMEKLIIKLASGDLEHEDYLRAITNRLDRELATEAAKDN